MDESVTDVIRFWNMLRSAESIPKEVLLEIADAKDATTISMLILLDKEYAFHQHEKQKAERQRRGI